MLLVFSHFFVPTMHLCPLGRSMLRLNTECSLPHPVPTERPRCTALPRLCRDTRTQQSHVHSRGKTGSSNQRWRWQRSQQGLDFLCTKWGELLEGSPLFSSWNTRFQLTKIFPLKYAGRPLKISTFLSWRTGSFLEMSYCPDKMQPLNSKRS